jgi:hypothetical protein
VVTHLRSCAINVTTTGNATDTVAGNITSWGVGFHSSPILSLLFPEKFSRTDETHVARAR